MTLQGKYRPLHPEKYRGDHGEIYYRSSWELEFCRWCDGNKQILSWQSEEKRIPYYDPVAKKRRTYFPDFYVKYRRNDGVIVEELVEVKPAKEVKGPPQNPKKRTKSWAYSVKTYAVNQAKWKAAREFCEDRKLEFKIMTEKELGIR